MECSEVERHSLHFVLFTNTFDEPGGAMSACLSTRVRVPWPRIYPEEPLIGPHGHKANVDNPKIASQEL